MASFQRSALQRFIRLREKSPPPVFVGRQAVINDILTIAGQTWVEKTGIPGNTTVITGAPGAGKSSLLAELENQAVPTSGARVITITNTDLEQNLSGITRAIAVTGSSEPAQWLDFKSRLGRTGIRTLFQKLDLSIPLYHHLSDLEHNQPSPAWVAPVIVAVDEVQRFAPSTTSPSAHFLQQIHDASTGLPLTLVLAGLSDAPSVIRSMGLTRSLQRHILGCFSHDEVQTLTDAWRDHFGIQIGSCRSQIDDLMAPTDGWPRHVHCAQQALAEALLITRVNGHADRITDWSAVQRRSDQLRQSYYDEQYSDVMDYSPSLTAQLLKDVGTAHRTGQPLNISQLRQKIKSTCDTDPSGTFECHPDHTAHSFITHLIHCGALEKNPETGTLSCPIPSFQSYILRRGGIDP